MRGLDVELGERQESGMGGSTYTVYVDGQLIGKVTGERETTARSTAGPVRWRYTGGGIWRVCSTRYEAVAFLVQAAAERQKR